MILPPELVSIIRDYSKPLFRYWSEYKEGLTALGEDEWPALKEMLCSEKAEEVVEVLKRYLTACAETDRLDEVFDDHNQRWAQACIPNTNTQLTYEYWDVYGDLKEDCRRAKIHEEIIYDELAEMVGPR